MQKGDDWMNNRFKIACLALQLKACKKKLLQKLKQDTGKVILLKDLTNLEQKMKKSEVQSSSSSAGIVMKFKVVLVDLSGTLHIGDEAVTGAVSALERLQQQEGLQIRFVTNTSKESQRALLQRLTAIGFKVGPKDVFSSLSAARRLIGQRQLRPFLMLDKEAMEDFHDVVVAEPNAVVVGLAPDEMTYANMTTAMRLIKGGAPLIAIHKARYYKHTDGELALGPGPFVAALEYATDTASEVVGKPSTQFFLSAIAGLGCDPSDCVMIGDDARDDIQGAQNAGMKGILVQTGKYRAGDECGIQPAPYRVVASFPQAVEELLGGGGGTR